jgi:hypothetical protein
MVVSLPLSQPVEPIDPIEPIAAIETTARAHVSLRIIRFSSRVRCGLR